MTLRSRIRAWVEKRLERYYEGPTVPNRYRHQAMLFARDNPLASRPDWMGFAVELADQAYRDAYVRGVEWEARGEQPGQDHAWEAPTLPQDASDDPLAGTTPQERLEFVQRLAVSTGGGWWPVLIPDDPVPDPRNPGSGEG